MEDQELPETVAQHIIDQKIKEDSKGDLFGQLIDHVSSNDYIPWEKIKLPSEGVYYGDKLPGGLLEVRPMGVAVEKMMSNQRLIQSGEFLNKIIELCTKMPEDLSVRELIAGDFNFLVYYIRGITHGTQYEFVHECIHCGSKNMHEFDLNELHETVKGPDSRYPEEPMLVRLDHISDTFNKDVFACVRLIRVDDIMKMSRSDHEIFDPVKQSRAQIKKKSNKTKVKSISTEDIYNNSMKLQVIGFEIDGQRFTDSRRMLILDKMHQGDIAILRNFIESISPGIDTQINVVCQNEECEKEALVSLPWSESFFRPNKRN
jgi:hypothetical protein